MSEARHNDKPRVLVSTVSGWSNAVGSDTMSVLFSRYDPEKLACLYIRSDLSDSPVCHRYFHIFEGRVIKSILCRGISTGEGYTTEGGIKETTGRAKDLEKEKKLYSKFSSFRPWSLILLRELLWKCGKWKTRALDAFLDDFKPEVLFFPIESYIHLNRINEYIIKRCKPRLVVCNLWDDNFTYKQSRALGFKIHRFWLRRHFQRLVDEGDVFIALCPKMQREFKAEYGKDAVILTKPIFDIGQFNDYKVHAPIKILYTGNLYINRDKSVIALAQAIKTLNAKGPKFELEVYSGTKLSEKQRKALECDPCCKFCGHISQSEVFVKQREADILLFVEDLSDRHLTARLSFSTKITDYLRAGKCIVAIGNSDLAPMEYFKENDAALVCTQAQQILPCLKAIAEDSSLIGKYARKAYECGKCNHDADAILEKLHSILTR